ncbi:hypothetical protein ABGB07_16495 [Micromonosporaceae bacterium B7E4]
MLADRLGVLADTVPFTPDDLPGYAGALFDALNATPELIRLTRWRALERDDATPGEIDSHLAKARALRTSMGLPGDAIAVDILEIVIAISGAWAGIAVQLRAAEGGDGEQRRRAHREVVVAAVAAIVRKFAGQPAAD